MAFERLLLRIRLAVYWLNALAFPILGCGIASAQGLPLEYYLKEGDKALAEERFSRAQEIFFNAGRTRDLSERLKVVEYLDKLGDEYDRQKDWEKAEFSFRNAGSFLETERGPDDLGVATILRKLAVVYKNMGWHYILSESLFQRVLAIREKALGLEHPDVADSLVDLGLILYFPGGRLNRAEPMFERALDIREKTLGPEHPKVGSSLHTFAFIRDFQGKFEEAESLYQRALKIWEKSLGPNSSEVAGTLSSLATIYEIQREFDKADSVWQRYLLNLKARLGSNHHEFISESERFSRRWWKTESKE